MGEHEDKPAPKGSPWPKRITLIVLATVAAIEGITLAYVGVPRLEDAFKRAEAPVPQIGLLTMNIGDFIRSYWFIPALLWAFFCGIAAAGTFDKFAGRIIVLLVLGVVLLACLYVFGIELPLTYLTNAVKRD